MADFTAAQPIPQKNAADLDLIELRITITRPDPQGNVVLQGPITARLITAELTEHSRPEAQFEDMPTAWKNADVATWTTRWPLIKGKLIP